MKQDVINNKLIQYKSLFWSPDYLDASSAWIEHIPFSFWLIEVLKPKTIVELGIHGGTSYFSFCQAVKLMNIDSVCYGIDTWRGDEHAGFYDEEVFQKVTNHNGREFSRFSTLIRSTFDEAREYFVDDSIDLLHIDGLHTYESVKNDFVQWLPKLSNNSFVIFHDINVRERNFGVFKFWEELKGKYAHFQFDFGYGLGIIAIGNIGPEELMVLVNKNEDYHAFLRNIFSERGRFFKVKSDYDTLIEHQRNQLVELAAINTQLNENLKVLELRIVQVKEKNSVIESQAIQINEEMDKLKLSNTQLAASNQALEVGNNEFKSSLAALESTNSQLLTNHQATAEANEQLTKYKESLELQVTQLSASLKEISEANEALTKHIKDIELTGSQLQAKCQEETRIYLMKVKELENATNDISEQLSGIKKENELFRKHIDWYKSTYEDRSILGVLKEKLKKKLK